MATQAQDNDQQKEQLFEHAMIHVQDDNSFHISQPPSITTHTTRSNIIALVFYVAETLKEGNTPHPESMWPLEEI